MISRTAEPAFPARDPMLDADTSMAPTAPAPLRLAPEVLKPLQKLSTVRALRALLGTWGLVAVSIAAALWSGHWAVWIAAAIVVGRCQHALAVLMHDAAHYRLFDHRGLNDFAGQWLCAKPIASHLYLYRMVHLRHHKHLHTAEDPDLALSAPFPCGRRSFLRKLLRDATGVSALAMRGYVTVDKISGRMRFTPGHGNLLKYWSARTVATRAAAVLLIGGLVWAGYGPAFLALWVLPLLVVYQVILRARGVLEHAAVPDKADPLKNARTVVSPNPLAQFFLNPHHVGYHLEHHLYPGVPHYHLPRLHAALAATGRFGGALVERRYTDSFAAIAGPA
ncbi:MAG: fatty acid desaturase family protein [Deltaproteobacteria bacterium]|nr:fatty acid desaturase family protein [Deltaproteobacteria bacterium]